MVAHTLLRITRLTCCRHCLLPSWPISGGLFAPGAILSAPGVASDAPPLRVVSLGGGPGYELLAYDWFSRYWLEVGEQGTMQEKQAWLKEHFDPLPEKLVTAAALATEKSHGMKIETDTSGSAAAADAKTARQDRVNALSTSQPLTPVGCNSSQGLRLQLASLDLQVLSQLLSCDVTALSCCSPTLVFLF